MNVNDCNNRDEGAKSVLLSASLDISMALKMAVPLWWFRDIIHSNIHMAVIIA